MTTTPEMDTVSGDNLHIADTDTTMEPLDPGVFLRSMNEIEQHLRDELLSARSLKENNPDHYWRQLEAWWQVCARLNSQVASYIGMRSPDD